MTRVDLTPAALIASLQQVASATSDTACAQALVASAALLQNAVLSDQVSEAFHAAIEAIPCELGVHMSEVMDRAVNFHLPEDGGTLGLWMVPVVISAEKALPAIIPLETKTLNAMKMSGCLLQQLKLTAEQSGGNLTGWTYVLPALYSEEQIRNADLGELLRLPREARAVVRGELDAITFTTGDDTGLSEGHGLYFLPFVAYAPAGVASVLPAASSKTMNRLSQWVSATLEPVLGDKFTTTVAQHPQPFSLSLRVGERMLLDVKLRDLMMRVTRDSGVEPNGLAALVAPYTTRQSDGTCMVGVSLVSRMTKNVVATLALPTDTDDGLEEVALVTHILKDMGMAAIQNHTAPIDTFACQHCGGMQFTMPCPTVATRGMTPASDTGVH